MYFHLIAGSKIMLVGGTVNDADDNVIEIIDVEDPSYSCPNALTFNPLSDLDSAGGGIVRYGQNDVPFICGGFIPGSGTRSECWQLLSR